MPPCKVSTVSKNTIAWVVELTYLQYTLSKIGKCVRCTQEGAMHGNHFGFFFYCENKLVSFFHTPVLLLLVSFVIMLSKFPVRKWFEPRSGVTYFD